MNFKHIQNLNNAYIKDFDDLQWWSINKNRFPLLYYISCKIPATNTSIAATESVFSVAKNLVNEKLSKLPPLKTL